MAERAKSRGGRRNKAQAILLCGLGCILAFAVASGQQASPEKAGPASRATASVIPENLPIRSQPSASAPVVKSLGRGQTVTVDLRVTGPEGAWCRIREPGLRDATGYALCSQLAEERAPRSGAVVPQRHELPGAAPLGPAAPQQPASPVAVPQARVLALNDPGAWFTPEFWAQPLALNAEQRKAMDELLASSGLAACRDDLERSYRRYGVSDEYSFLMRLGEAGRNPFRDSFIVVTETKLKRGAVKYRAFWGAFEKLLNAEQKAAAAGDIRFQILLMDLRSDPEFAFHSYAMRHMQQR